MGHDSFYAILLEKKFKNSKIQKFINQISETFIQVVCRTVKAQMVEESEVCEAARP